MKNHPRVVWITGASSGIGKALAEVFAGSGDTVVATSRRLVTLRSVQKQLRRAGIHCEVKLCDVQKEGDIQRTAKSILKRYRRIDILINNAGVTSFTEFLRTPTNEFDDIL